eukprot:3348529-Prymnesium_polylepis.1
MAETMPGGEAGCVRDIGCWRKSSFRASNHKIAALHSAQSESLEHARYYQHAGRHGAPSGQAG